VEINSGVRLLKRLIHQVPLFTSGGLGLDILVLVLRIWSCLHHWPSSPLHSLSGVFDDNERNLSRLNLKIQSLHCISNKYFSYLHFTFQHYLQ